jgi:hypothetical protein
MTVGQSSTFANAELNVLRGTTNTGVTVYVQLHTADPGAAGTTGVSVGSTTRNAATWNAASGGSMTISSISAWTNGGTSETITHVSFWTASSGGTFIQSAALSASQAWASTNTLTLTTLTVTKSNIAA